MIPETSEINVYIRTLGDLLGLRDWVLTYDGSMQFENADVLGECRSAPNRKDGSMRFQDELFAKTVDEQRNAFVHELIHMHTRDARNVGRDLLYDNRLLSNDVYRAVFYALDTALERAVDGIAFSVAKFMPYPPWIDSEAK